MPIQDLKAQIARLPEQPGVYLYSNGAGETLYVGKARALRDRVRSYLGAQGMSPRIDALLEEARHLEVIVTDSVVEALALENHLIKQRAPKYNILLRDDKNYPYLQLTTGEAFPRVLVARRVEKDDHYYAGPFLPASLARKTMALTHRLFGMRSCNEVITGERSRPCLEYDIRRCIAPCVREICTEEEYGVAVQHTKLFLEGRSEELLVDLRGRMGDAASAERFEQAAQLRDAIRTIETLRQRQQKMSTTEMGDRDAFGLKLGPAGAVVQVFQVRHGRVVERVELVTDVPTAEGRRQKAEERLRPERGAKSPSESERGWGPASAEKSGQNAVASTECEVLQAAVEQFYAEREAPPEIHLPVALPDADTELLEAWLTDRASRRVRIVVPKRGEKRGLLDLAARNAALAYQTRFNETVAAHYDALETLRAVLGLPSLPRRIECFDISTIQGAETVASMVVCEDGRMKRGEYRKFRIRGVNQMVDRHPPSRILDDFASMHEVVHRRYRKMLEQGGPFPDLILIDGGKGQLSAAYQALEELGLANLVAAGIAKKEELLFTRDRVDPIALASDSPALLLIQRIRDEAHRFAVTFHRQRRARRDLRSELDEIAGVGPRRRKAMLTAFGSLAAVRRATREDLVAVVGAKCADAVLAHFASER
ncbi:MAG: excinuclease ABC subunit UvrC [Acidobacteria bacterium]|nr:MAG: excinuclease ABC subunit UvrC [Acidobacteriota bacterium]